MLESASTSLLNQYLNISRLLAGQLDFHSAIHAVAEEVNHIIPNDHMDVCIITPDSTYHTAYESGFDTEWSKEPPALISGSPIRSVLYGEADYLLTGNACTDPVFHFKGAFSQPIIDNQLRSRLHVPLKVRGKVIGALSCSSRTPDLYSIEDVDKARSIADLLAPYFFALRAADQAKRSAIIEAEARAREEGLRLGALTLTEALEAERQRIGMDLHDQTLADLTRLARRLERLSHVPDLAGSALAPLFRSLQHSMQDLRQIIEEARPSVLELFGLAQAIETHLDRSIRDSGQPMEWRLEDLSGGAIERLSQTASIQLFRIAQEAINNAIRHSQGSRIHVRLASEADEIVLEVRDDGKGIGKAERDSAGGMQNMKTRARLISARFEADIGKDGTGTMIRVALHLPPADKEQAR